MRKVEIHPSFAPNVKSGMSKTTGGTTINEISIPRTVSLPFHFQWAKPHAAHAAITRVMSTANRVTKKLFLNQVGN
ncbi:unannotated protein [freshwater metagenome]|uniref:Unannotated protein n=1 Tax=freshwater metagenome TaxID=449393 RepID=A0A6J7T7F7_9ZZZZ